MATGNTETSTLEAQIATWQQQLDASTANINQANSDIASYCSDDSLCGFFGKPSCGTPNNPAVCSNARNNLAINRGYASNNPSLIANATAQLAKVQGSTTVWKVIGFVVLGIFIIVGIYFFGKKKGWFGK